MAWVEEIEHLQTKARRRAAIPGTRRIRTPEGAEKYGQPIGTIIRPGASPAAAGRRRRSRDGEPRPGVDEGAVPPPRQPVRPRPPKPRATAAKKPTARAKVDTVPAVKIDRRKEQGQTRSNFVHPDTGHALGKTETGDTFEQLFKAKMQANLEDKFGCCLKLITGAGEGTARNTPLDFQVGNRGGEVKTLSARSKNQKTAIKKEEVARKVKACRAAKLKSLLIVQVVDQDSGRVSVYGYPQFASKAVSAMTLLGSYDYSGDDFKAAQVASGHWDKRHQRAADEAKKKTQTKSAVGQEYDPPDEEGGVIEPGDTVIELRDNPDGTVVPWIWTEPEEDGPEPEAKHLPGRHDQDRHGRGGPGSAVTALLSRAPRAGRKEPDATRDRQEINTEKVAEALADGLDHDYGNLTNLRNRWQAKAEVAAKLAARLDPKTRDQLADRAARDGLGALRHAPLFHRIEGVDPFDHDTIWKSIGDDADWSIDIVRTSEKELRTAEGREIPSGGMLQGDRYRRGDDPELREALVLQGVSDFIHSWADTSNNHSARSLAIQDAISQEFGLDRVMSWEVDREEWGPINYPKYEAEQSNIPLYRTLVRAMYDETQEWLAGHGMEEITLHRGMKWESDDEMPDWALDAPDDRDGAIRPVGGKIRFRPGSSWASNRTTAWAFADSDYSVIVSSVFPAGSILATPRSGFGCLNEYEFVVLAPESGTVRVART